MPHIVRSALVYTALAAAPAAEAADATLEEAETAEEVWYAEARTCEDTSVAGALATFGAGGGAVNDIEAVAMDRRERTRSSGYVEPE